MMIAREAEGPVRVRSARGANHRDPVMPRHLIDRQAGRPQLRPAAQGSTHEHDHPQSTPTATEDRLAILDLIARLGLLTDARDWNALEKLFTNSPCLGGLRVDRRRPPRLSAQADRGRLADRRDHVHSPMGDRQRAHPDGRDCRLIVQRDRPNSLVTAAARMSTVALDFR
jgi:hypothetical protein